MKGIIAIGIVLVILCVATIQKVDSVYTLLSTGKHLKEAKVIFSLSVDTPWASLPVFIRDDMAKEWSGNKLGKEDLIEIRDYYTARINNYTEPIGVGDDFEKGKLKGGK